MNIGKAIKALRQKRGYSQKQLASLIGKSETAVSLIESGKSIPQTKRIREISKALGVEPTYLLLFAIEKDDVQSDKQVLFDTLLVPLREALTEERKDEAQ